jgi:hypothetical protein
MAQERLPSREPDPVHPEIAEDADETVDLLEREDRVPRKPDVLLLRHAIAAAHIAAVGYGNPQRAEGPTESIGQRVSG